MQLYSFEGMMLPLEQINKIRAEREKEAQKEATNTGDPNGSTGEPNDPPKKLTRHEMMKLLKEKGIPFTAKMKNDELRQLLS